MIYSRTYKDNSGTVYEVVAAAGDYDYSWSEEVILRRESDGALFYTQDSGCSCTYFGEGGDLSLTPVRTYREALSLAHNREKLDQSLRLGGTEVDYSSA